MTRQYLQGPILAFDTSAAHCAAVLLQADGSVTAEAFAPMARGQAEALMPLLEAVLARAGMGWGELAALAVGVGPGNFTGIRISVAAARGLALALGIPAVGVSGFDAMADGAAPTGAVVLVCLPGARGVVNAQILRDGSAVGAPLAIDPEQAPPAFRPPPDRVLGRAGQALAAVLALPFSPLPSDSDIALHIARIAAARLRSDGPPVARPAPLYVRPADAAPSSAAPAPMLD